ncbi:hypothetical protein Q7P36_010746 [Cladosporium allicinum]
MALLGLALLLSILPADACKQRDTTVFYRKKADIVLFIVYSNATISNTAGRAPVPITVSPSKPPMNTTTTTHAISHYLSGSKPHGTNASDAIVVPESIEGSPQIPLSCLRPDVTCTLQTTVTKIIATKTVPNAITVGTSQSMETGTLVEGIHNSTAEVIKTNSPSQTSTESDGSPSASTTSREKPVFSYDPIKISTSSSEAENVASPSPTTSGSLNALSVLESALSAFTTISSSFHTVEASSSSPDQSSGWIYFPYPTEIGDASSHTEQRPNDKSTSERIQSMTATYASSPASTTLSSATSLTSPDGEPALHFTLQPTSDEELPKTESMSSTDDSESQSGASLTYSPSPINNLNKTITTRKLTNPDDPRIRLSHSGAPVTLEQGEVLSYATDGLAMANPSGAMQSMSTVAAPQETGQDASGELPVVVQQPAPSESSSETTSAADAASTGSSETAGDSSNGSERLVQANWMALVVFVAFMLLMV